MAQTTDFVPVVRYITDITQALIAVVTTSEAHEYVSGTIVRLYIPLAYGMQQINHKKGAISVIDATSFYFPLDTLLYDPFVVPVSAVQQAQCVPIGEITSIVTAAKDNIAWQQ